MLISGYATPRWPRILLVLAILVIVCTFLFGSSVGSDSRVLPSWPDVQQIPTHISDWVTRKKHPIDALIADASSKQQELESKRTYGVKDAAAAYRKRRGRHPPPKFDKWVEYAESKEALMVEEFFDQIHRDINPFWALDPQLIRDTAASWEYVISIRDGNTTVRWDNDVKWVALWAEMIEDALSFIPDLDIAVNHMDESRLLVPWKKINEYMNTSNAVLAEASSYPHSRFQNDFTVKLGEVPSREERPEPPPGHDFISAPYWSLFKETCPPDTEAQKAMIENDFSVPPQFPLFPLDDRGGFVQNISIARDPCLNPHLRGLHGTFVEPVSMSTDKALFPLFGGSKLPQNNEILLPAPMYFSNDEAYSGGDKFLEWEEKKSALVWRGSATGGRNREDTWTRFQRHRFIAMCNGSWVDSLHASTLSGEVSSLPAAFPFPRRNIYNLTAREKRKMSEWLDATTNAKFNHLQCFPAPEGGAPGCPYTGKYYPIGGSLSLYEQYTYKFLPDIDGNSFSGRYRALLRSHSVPLKATIYKEWHDDRLIPWRHYVPMDNTFVDFWGIWEYFVGYKDDHPSVKTRKERDDKARDIAEAGSEWANRVLRREDMTVYMARALLEYARVADDERERLGYVEDLL